MINLIKADFYRIFKSKVIYVCVFFILLSGFVSSLSLSPGHVGIAVSGNTNDMLTNPEILEKIQNAKTLSDFRDVMKANGEFELDREILGQNINLYYIFIAVTVVVLCVDFSNHTVKNTIASSISRRKYYVAKTLVILMISSLLLLLNNLSAYLINHFLNGTGFSAPFGEILKITIIQLPLIYGIISMLIAFGFIFGRTSVFNTVAIPFIMVVQLIGLGLINLFRLKALWFYDFEVQFALAKLASGAENDYIIKCALLGLFYIVLFNFVGYFIFKRKEIK